MQTVELSGGRIEYEDTRGDGPPVVFLHGLVMDGSVWRNVVASLRGEFRCLVPTFPLGAHRIPMKPDFALSPRSVSRLIGEFIEALYLDDVTLVENDAGRAQAYAATNPARVSRLVLSSCEALDNYPPGLPGKIVAFSAKIPGGLNGLAQPLRLRFMRRLPIALGLMTKRKVPDEITDRWLAPVLNQPAIRRDLIRYLRAVDSREMLEAAEKLSAFNRPALVVWAEEDRVMPIETGRRLAKALPKAEFATIADSYTLIPEDRPDELSRLIREFIRKHPSPS